MLHGLELLAAVAFSALILLDANLPGLLAGGEAPREQASPRPAAPRPATRPATRAAGSSTRPASLPADAAGIVGRPYLLDVRRNEITLGVLTVRPLRPVIGYGTTVAISAPFRDTVQCGPPRRIPGTGLWVAEARLSGLTADTIYSYRIRAAGPTAAGMFRTARPPGAWFRFIVCGDTDRPPAAARLWTTVARSQPTPQFLLHTGAYAAKDWAAEFFAPAAAVLGKVPLVPTVFDDASRQAFSPLAANPYYVLPLGAGRLLCLDTRREADFAPGSAQFAWLRQQLTRPKDGWTFVALRRGPFSLGAGDAAVRRHLVGLFEQHGVDAVFSGATAGYQRAEWGGVPYFAVSAHRTAEPPIQRVPGWYRVADLANRKLVHRPCFLQVDANNAHITFTAVDAETGETIEQVKRLRTSDGAARFDPTRRVAEALRSDQLDRRRWAAAYLMDHYCSAKRRFAAKHEPTGADRAVLRRLATDADPYVRVMAVRALARCNGGHAAGTVLSRLADRDPATLTDALAFFAEHEYRMFAPLAAPIAEEILDAGPHGGRTDPRAAERLLRALAGALARHPSPTHASLLVRIWSDRRALPAVRAFAFARWLAIVTPSARDDRVVKLATARQTPSFLRIPAVAELARGGDLPGLHALIELSLRPEPSAETAASVRAALADFRPSGDAVALIAMLCLAERHVAVVPAGTRRRIHDALRETPDLPGRAIASGALNRLDAGQLIRYLRLHRRLTDAARWVGLALAAWLLISRGFGLLRTEAFGATVRPIPVRSLNVLLAVAAVAAALGFWHTGSGPWAGAWAILAGIGLWLWRRWLNRRWPTLDPEALPAEAALHERVRCRLRCALTVLAAIAMIVLTLRAGY